MSREDDIQELCNQVLGDKDNTIAEYNNDYNNGDYWECPLCHNDVSDYYAKDDKNIMDQITHDLNCGYLIAKDLSTNK